MKKALVLGALFIIPIVAYLFFASGVHYFVKLPVLTSSIQEVNDFSSLSEDHVSLTKKITILVFLGTATNKKKGMISNLNQKIYKRFYKFDDFQMVTVFSENTRKKAIALKEELGSYTDLRNWKFIFGTQNSIDTLFNSLNTTLTLDMEQSTPYVFIIDKDRNLRGRKDPKNTDNVYGFDATSVAEISNKMLDDVKIILAEYRLALKKNNAYSTP